MKTRYYLEVEVVADEDKFAQFCAIVKSLANLIGVKVRLHAGIIGSDGIRHEAVSDGDITKAI